MHVAVLPLKDEYREKFDSAAAEEWFKYMEGYPYGYHNFMLGWIDTVEDNLPPALAPELLPIAFEIIEHISPATTMTMLVRPLTSVWALLVKLSKKLHTWPPKKTRPSWT